MRSFLLQRVFFFSIDETAETSRVACAVGSAELSKAWKSKEQLVTLNEDRARETDVSEFGLANLPSDASVNFLRQNGAVRRKPSGTRYRK